VTNRLSYSTASCVQQRARRIDAASRNADGKRNSLREEWFATGVENSRTTGRPGDYKCYAGAQYLKVLYFRMKEYYFFDFCLCDSSSVVLTVY
jgi:hypothetical protein